MWPLTLFYNMIAVSLMNFNFTYAHFEVTPIIKHFYFIHLMANYLISKHVQALQKFWTNSQ